MTEVLNEDEKSNDSIFNTLEFHEKTFKQKRGTAIETKFAPPYAILYMVHLEEKLLEMFEKKQ